MLCVLLVVVFRETKCGQLIYVLPLA